jgi:primosomal protein N''
VFEPCERFDVLRADAPAAERAYADYLAARPLAGEDIARLPAAQQAAARGDATLASVQSIEDPLARLIAAAVLFQAGKASPAMIEAATETASAQCWRRPLLSWLKVQALRAEKAGDTAEAQRLQRRIALVEGAS